MKKLLIFDLDNTLASEREYVRSGFGAVADYIHQKKSLPKEEVFNCLIQSFFSSGRGRNFNELKEKFPLDNISIEEMVKVYRSHLPSIRLFPEAAQVLEKLSKKYKLCIITNGIVEAQRMKVKALQLDKYFDKFFFAQKNGKEFEKPHRKVFEDALTHFGLAPSEAVMIGDDIVTDIEGATAVGIDTIFIKGPRDLLDIEKRLEETIKK